MEVRHIAEEVAGLLVLQVAGEGIEVLGGEGITNK